MDGVAIPASAPAAVASDLAAPSLPAAGGAAMKPRPRGRGPAGKEWNSTTGEWDDVPGWVKPASPVKKAKTDGDGGADPSGGQMLEGGV